MTTQAALRIDVFSDYVCPFCYLELPVLERLVQESPGAIEVCWRAFELRPEPVPTLDPGGDYLRSTWARVVYPLADQRGLTMKLPPMQPRSRKALEAAAHAREEGRFEDMHRAIFRAFFEQGRDIGETEVLVDIGVSAGLEAAPLRQALEDGRHGAEVREDKRLAQELHITAVPAMLLRRAGADWHSALPLNGALPYEQVREAVNAVRR